MAMLAATGVRYDQWMRFTLRWWGVLLVLAGAAVLLAIKLRI
jgi:uncharacterized ion transporter superfamily protein YfcC